PDEDTAAAATTDLRGPRPLPPASAAPTWPRSAHSPQTRPPPPPAGLLARRRAPPTGLALPASTWHSYGRSLRPPRSSLVSRQLQLRSSRLSEQPPCQLQLDAQTRRGEQVSESRRSFSCSPFAAHRCASVRLVFALPVRLCTYFP